MPTPKPADVDAYLAAQPPEARAALVNVRAAMRRALPTSVEAIKYGMPAYLVDGRAVASFAGWKDHYALYIVSSTLFEAITKDLEGREASKGIIRFKLDEPVPESVVVRLSEWNAVAGRIASDVPKKPTKPKAAASPTPKRNTRRRAP
ncbi:iron chaperone [Sorangium sp. So ce394]|uniref:iron chaperone n=1 Tax=Sorangium sp. So ce394 TaxID=3133310 RepID=UPI003F5CA204